MAPLLLNCLDMFNRLPACLLLLATTLLTAAACGVCAKAPVCDDDESEVASCEGIADCRELEECGTTVGCVPAALCEATPTCLPTEHEVTACPVAVACETRTLCGTSILCAPLACTNSAECATNEYCDFSDGLCGAGVGGECKLGPEGCSDGPSVCFCDGTTSGDGGFGCEGWGGKDLDESGGCQLASDQFACGHRVCSVGSNYCQLVSNDTGGPPYPDCGFAPAGCSPVTCACLVDQIAACGGTCVDGPDFPTVTCPGG